MQKKIFYSRELTCGKKKNEFSDKLKERMQTKLAKL